MFDLVGALFGDGAIVVGDEIESGNFKSRPATITPAKWFVDNFNASHAGKCMMRGDGSIIWQPGHVEKKISQGARYMYELYE